jgi:hypothetical protein
VPTPTTDLNPIFTKNAGVIPEGFLRVLAYKESGFRPDVVHPTSKATGLFQITQTALSSFNQRNGSALQLPQLVDPELNTRVAAQHLASVVSGYSRYRTLQPDWTSRRWLELLTLGWNAGHNAIAQIVGRMEANGLPIDRINVDTVSQAATSMGASARFVADPKRVAWAKSLTAVRESTASKVVLVISGLLLVTAGVLKAKGRQHDSAIKGPARRGAALGS